MTRLLILIGLLATAGIIINCGGTASAGNNSSPTDAYKALYAAVKSKDTEAIKRQLSKKTIEFGEMSSQRFHQPIEKSYENGFTATTFSDTLPEIRDQRINGDMGAIEVWDAKDNRWDDLPFIIEDGSWRLAIGDQFAGSFKSPGKGRAELEKEAANAESGNSIQLPTPATMPSVNANSAANARKAGNTAKP